MDIRKRVTALILFTALTAMMLAGCSSQDCLHELINDADEANAKVMFGQIEYSYREKLK